MQIFYLLHIFLEPPEIGPFSFSKEVMNEKDFAQISCIVTSGDKPLTITWTFHGESLEGKGLDNGISISNLGSRMSMLVIDEVKHSHQGNYTCQASNKAGTRTHTARLVVNGKHNYVVGSQEGIFQSNLLTNSNN